MVKLEVEKRREHVAGGASWCLIEYKGRRCSALFRATLSVFSSNTSRIISGTSHARSTCCSTKLWSFQEEESCPFRSCQWEEETEETTNFSPYGYIRRVTIFQYKGSSRTERFSRKSTGCRRSRYSPCPDGGSTLTNLIQRERHSGSDRGTSG